MTIHEPATLATDYLLAVLGAVCGWRLQRSGGNANLPQRWWTRALWLMAAAAAVGGSFHGFGPMLSVLVRESLWRATLLLIGLTSAAMTLTLVYELASPASLRRWSWFVWAKFAGFAGLALVWPVFFVAMIDYGFAMLLAAAAALLARRVWSASMLAGVAFSGFAAVVQQAQWGLSPRFNHNDLYHLIQGCGILCFYRAGQYLGRPPARRFAS